MLVVTPFVGRLYNKMPPAVMIGVGAVAFIIGNIQLSHITLQSGAMDIVTPLVITGFGLAALMIPLTTVALTSIERKDLADAAGLSSFIRQMGGSIGLTIFATLLTRFAVRAKASVSWHITDLRPEAHTQVTAMTQRFMQRVGDPNLSHALALAVMNGKATLQGMVLAFESSFLLQGMVFVAVLPLLIFLKVDRQKAAPTEHIELGLE